jgi:hypothetical protein
MYMCHLKSKWTTIMSLNSFMDCLCNGDTLISVPQWTDFKLNLHCFQPGKLQQYVIKRNKYGVSHRLQWTCHLNFFILSYPWVTWRFHSLNLYVNFYFVWIQPTVHTNFIFIQYKHVCTVYLITVFWDTKQSAVVLKPSK